MKINGSNKSFEPCPEFTGRAVCVDSTPLRKQQSQYGERDVFRLVFEVDQARADGSRFHVWSRGFTPSLNEKSAFRKFLRAWLGRDLTPEECQTFDTDTLIGKPAHLVVVHEHREGNTFANIAACLPDKSGAPLAPSGKYVRVQDRPAIGNGNDNGGDLGATKVHVGRCSGLELRELSVDQVQAIIEKWLPTAQANPNPSADDKKLMAGLDWWVKSRITEDDDVAF